MTTEAYALIVTLIVGYLVAGIFFALLVSSIEPYPFKKGRVILLWLPVSLLALVKAEIDNHRRKDR